MADNIVTRLQCVYDPAGCDQCTFCLAKAEIERLRVDNLRLEQANSAMKDAVHQLRWDNRRLSDLYEGLFRRG